MVRSTLLGITLICLFVGPFASYGCSGQSSVAGAPTISASPTGQEADIVARIKPSVVQVVTNAGSGSGVKIERGILTAEHVIHGAVKIDVVTQEGTKTPAFVTRSDPKRDLALLLTEAMVPSSEIEEVALQRQGDTVLVLGYPRASIIGDQVTLTRGLISAIREDKDNDRILIQTDAALNPGNSGGPIFNLRAKLIGIATMGVKDSVGLGFGVATDSVRAFLATPATPISTPTLPASTPRPSKGFIPADSRLVALTLRDLRQGWAMDEGRANDRDATFTFFSYIWSGQGIFSPDGLTHIYGIVEVVSSLNGSPSEIAAGHFQVDGRYGWQQVAVPQLGDYTVAKTNSVAKYYGPSIINSISVRVSNVYLTVYVAGPTETSNIEKAKALMQVMLDRLY